MCEALATILLRNNEGTEQLYAHQVHPLLVKLLEIHSTKTRLIVIIFYDKTTTHLSVVSSL